MSFLAAISTIFLGGAALTNGADVVCSQSLAVDESRKSGEIGFVTDWPADVHWFGAYLRKDEDRYSIHPEPFVAGGYFEPGKPLDDGMNSFKFIVKPGFVSEGMAQVRFRARHAKNPTPPDAAAVAALGKKAHPRLMLKSGDDVFARIKGATATNELLAAAVRHMKQFADMTLAVKPDVYSLDGRRLWSQPCTARTFSLAQMWKMQLAGAFFVMRPKDNMRYEVVRELRDDAFKSDVRADFIIRLTGVKSRKLYPDELRLVKVLDPEGGELITFITNNLDFYPQEIANIYRHRWDIEVFFKWIKQNITIKSLWGYSENAVKTHLWVAITAYLLLAKIKADTHSPYSITEVATLIRVSALEKTELRELLTRPIDSILSNQNVKELMLFNNL